MIHFHTVHTRVHITNIIHTLKQNYIHKPSILRRKKQMPSVSEEYVISIVTN